MDSACRLTASQGLTDFGATVKHSRDSTICFCWVECDHIVTMNKRVPCALKPSNPHDITAICLLLPYCSLACPKRRKCTCPPTQKNNNHVIRNQNIKKKAVAVICYASLKTRRNHPSHTWTDVSRAHDLGATRTSVGFMSRNVSMIWTRRVAGWILTLSVCPCGQIPQRTSHIATASSSGAHIRHAALDLPCVQTLFHNQHEGRHSLSYGQAHV